MRFKTIPAFLTMLVLVITAQAQTKASGTAKCAKPETSHAIEVGDRPHHSFNISQSKCSWTKPMEIGGVQTKEGTGTAFDEMSATTSHFHGYYLDTMANGDKATYRYQGASTLKDGVLQSAESKWTLESGTGKLKGTKGQGTCKGKGEPDGGVTWDCEGEYQLAK